MKAIKPENIDTTFAGGNIYPVGVLRGLCPLKQVAPMVKTMRKKKEAGMP